MSDPVPVAPAGSVDEVPSALAGPPPRDLSERTYAAVLARAEAAEAELASVRHALHLLELHHHCYCKWPHPSECEAGIRARALFASQPLPSEPEEQ